MRDLNNPGQSVVYAGNLNKLTIVFKGTNTFIGSIRLDRVKDATIIGEAGSSVKVTSYSETNRTAHGIAGVECDKLNLINLNALIYSTGSALLQSSSKKSKGKTDEWSEKAIKKCNNSINSNWLHLSI